MYFERNAKYDSSKYEEQQSSTVKHNLFSDGIRYGRPKTIWKTVCVAFKSEQEYNWTLVII